MPCSRAWATIWKARTLTTAVRAVAGHTLNFSKKSLPEHKHVFRQAHFYINHFYFLIGLYTEIHSCPQSTMSDVNLVVYVTSSFKIVFPRF